MNKPNPLGTAQSDKSRVPPLQLADEESFLAHPWVESLIPRFLRDDALARHAMHRLTEDLRNINELHIARERRSFFTSIDGRVKTQLSFFRKLYHTCQDRSDETGVTPQTLSTFY